MKIINRAIKVWERSLPARILNRFFEVNGPVLANGMAYAAVFSVFALAWLGIGIFSAVLSSNQQLFDDLVQLVNLWIPNLFDLGEGGAIDPTGLKPDFGVISFSSFFAVVVLAFTALGWLGSTRAAVHSTVGDKAVRRNIFLEKAVDLLILLIFGVMLLVAAALSGFVGIASGSINEFLGAIGLGNGFNALTVALVSSLLSAVFNYLILVMLFKVLAPVQIPFSKMQLQLVVGAIGLTLMQLLAGYLLGGASNNPLLATFAILVGIMLWFNLISQLVLLIAAWLYFKNPELGPKTSESGELKTS